MNFDEAQEFVARNAGLMDQQVLLKCYALYKSATAGPCSSPKPAFYEFQKRAKWEAWSSLGQMSIEEAREKYIVQVSQITIKAGQPNTSTGVAVSTMNQQDLDVENKSVYDYARDGNLAELQKLKLSIDDADENKMTILHWAADRGHLEIVEYLLHLGFDCNFPDSEGSTPLHHAAYSGHELTYAALIKEGGKPDIQNFDGETPEGLMK